MRPRSSRTSASGPSPTPQPDRATPPASPNSTPPPRTVWSSASGTGTSKPTPTPIPVSLSAAAVSPKDSRQRRPWGNWKLKQVRDRTAEEMAANGFIEVPRWAQLPSKAPSWAKVVWRLLQQRTDTPAMEWVGERLGLTPQRWSIERRLPETGWLYLTQLAKILSLPSSTLARMFEDERARYTRDRPARYTQENIDALRAAKSEASRTQGWYRGAGQRNPTRRRK